MKITPRQEALLKRTFIDYHAMSASGTGSRKTKFEPQMPGFLKVFPPTHDRGQFATWEECNRVQLKIVAKISPSSPYLRIKEADSSAVSDPCLTMKRTVKSPGSNRSSGVMATY